MKTQTNHLLFIFAIIVVMITACGKDKETPCSWTILNSGTAKNLNSVFFTDSLTGYAVGSENGSSIVLALSIIIKTKDGGNTWTEQKSGRISGNLTSVFFIGEIGYAVGYESYSIDTNYYCKGTILKTTNGGDNWVVQTSHQYKSLSSVYFISADTGYAVGNTVLSTVDGGENWTEHQGPYTMKLNAVFAIGNRVYSTLENSDWYYDNSVVKTTNSFNTWNVDIGFLTSASNFPCITGLYFTDENTGYFVTERHNGAIYKTTNGGSDWIAQTTGTTKNLYAIYFQNSNQGYAVGGDSYTEYHSSNLLDYTEYKTSFILKTTDAGTNWVAQPSEPIKSILRSVYFVGNTGYAVGDNGTIIKTIDYAK